MSTWSKNKQIHYLAIVFGTLFLIGGFFLYNSFHKPASCFDNKQNQDEKGVDCGGSCSKACLSTILNPVVLWSRTVKVDNGVYDAVAFIENPNTKEGVSSLAYKFKLYDDENILVIERAGKTFINPNERFYIFESNIRTGERIPKRAFFEFQPSLNWEQTDNTKPIISVNSEKFIEEESRLKVNIKNNLFFELEDIVITAILFDDEGNAFAVSETVIDSLLGDQTKEVFFTWPKLLGVKPSKIEIIPRVNIFEVDS